MYQTKALSLRQNVSSQLVHSSTEVDVLIMYSREFQNLMQVSRTLLLQQNVMQEKEAF